MTDKVFLKKDWVEALKAARDSFRIFVPVRDGDFHNFHSLEDWTIPNFDFFNTRLSPKSIVYPQSERIFECLNDPEDPGKGILKEAPKDYPPQAIVGIRPCDAHAFHIVKKNFEGPEYRDPWWMQRFESTVLVGLGCNAPCPTCFCTSVGGGPFHEEYLDAILFDLGDRYLARGLTEKGGEFISKMNGGSSADEKSIKEAKGLVAEAEKKVVSRLPFDKIGEKEVTGLFNAPFWEEAAFSCINCGTCTFLCPTCWCFDIQDEVSGRQVDRIRNWDTCMSPLFTLEGSGHNPRDKKFQRFRQRFMHKLKYYPDKYKNGVQCSGCGRCVRYCPVNIDIRTIAGLMNEF
ncbi:MAG: 4Fe-4S dicluster domain-containing protein [Deltaproteobacteria bacterium]|nr:4Fe-4S dicluster domain-containing protein [Deltaproteobacteria bacterium]